MNDEELKQYIGTSSGKVRVVIERGPVANFATAVCDDSELYKDPRAALAAGLSGIPVPPTYPFAMDRWGAFQELQPDDNDPVKVYRQLFTQLGPGLILHGEQAFEYHRPIHVGDVLEGEAVLVDVYAKESKGHVMTFAVTETTWTDNGTREPVLTSRSNLIHRA